MSFTSDLLRGLAQYLNDRSVGVTYKPAGGYLATETAVFFKALPTSPNRVVVLSAYGATDEAKIALSHLRVQFWFRGDPDNSLDVDDLGDAVFQVMQGLEHQTFGTAHVVQALRVSSVQLGIDGSKRSERTDNYALDVNVPTTAGRPD